jgi:hypothetical protein
MTQDTTPTERALDPERLRARLDEMAPLSSDGITRYARVAGDYLAELAAVAIATLEEERAAHNTSLLIEGTAVADRDRLLDAERAARAEPGLREALRFDRPWPLTSVLAKLADYADHGLSTHSCDHVGYEGVMQARDAARDILAALEAPGEPQEGKR